MNKAEIPLWQTIFSAEKREQRRDQLLEEAKRVKKIRCRKEATGLTICLFITSIPVFVLAPEWGLLPLIGCFAAWHFFFYLSEKYGPLQKGYPQFKLGKTVGFALGQAEADIA